ncbi:MAG: permease, partial [Thermoleophilia bacterium]|nr:permease [Thermoleophilia bacterium]
QHWAQTVLILANGFIVTSLLWATTLAHLIDRRVRSAALTMALAAVFAWFGVIHSPLPSSPILSPAEAVARLEAEGRGKAAERQTPYQTAAAYAATAVAIALIGRFGTAPAPGSEEDPLAI